jgi:hypothetical protein
MVRISHTNLKNRMVISRIATSKKSHRNTRPRSDLRPDSWSRANSGLDTTSRIFETEIKQRLSTAAVLENTMVLTLVDLLKTNWSKFTHRVLVKNTSGLTCDTPERVSGLYVELQHVADVGQESDRQKVALRPTSWLCKMTLLAKGLVLSSSFYVGTILY